VSDDLSAKPPVDSKALRAWALETGDKPSSLRVYRVVRGLVRRLLFPWLRVQGFGVERLDLPGPMILAPVHRSNLDSVVVASLSARRIRALGKQSLFTTPVVRYFCAALGAIPVKRGEADRDALTAAKALLDRGESMIVFPEGTRQSTGEQIGELFGGAAWLAARTGARVIPIGIAGTDVAMGAGAKSIKRSTVRVVVGEPLEPPTDTAGHRANRDDLDRFTELLAERLAAAQAEAHRRR
jgi:1-acyl-sn-glycerol-3-phosphate acyltransferase